MPATRPTVIELAHENPVIEAGLRYILGEWPEFELRPSVKPNRSVQGQAPGPDMLILDHERALHRAATHHQIDAFSGANVLVVAMRGQEIDVRSALESGIRGYVVVGCSADEIVRAARAVAAGRRYLCSAATLRMADSLAQPSLTLRESEVLALVFRGHNNKEVARLLGISVGTVKAHMRGLLSKLGARCRTEALWIASERGLLTRQSGYESEQNSPSRRAVTHGTWSELGPVGERLLPVPNLGFLQPSAA